MDIVQTIMGMFSGSTLSKLSSQIGENESTTKAAVGAAVPAMLAGMSQVASSPSGAQRLISTLGQFGGGTADQFGNMLSGQPGNVAEQGNSILKSLFGAGGSGLGSVLSRVTGVGTSSMSKLMALVAPLVMGGMAKQFMGQTLTPSSISNFFAGQKANVANALPSGFSLAEVPGLSVATSGAQVAYQETKQVAQAAYRETTKAAPNAAKWLIPALLGLGLLAALAYFGLRNRAAPVVRAPAVPSAPVLPLVPDLTQVQSTLSGTVGSITETLSGIRDPSTAERALPRLQELDAKLDTTKSWADKLPATEKSTISQYAGSNLSGTVDRMNSILKMPGMPEKLRPVLESISAKLGSIAGVPSSEYKLAPAIPN